jgi:hypothetical protein
LAEPVIGLIRPSRARAMGAGAQPARRGAARLHRRSPRAPRLGGRVLRVAGARWRRSGAAPARSGAPISYPMIARSQQVLHWDTRAPRSRRLRRQGLHRQTHLVVALGLLGELGHVHVLLAAVIGHDWYEIAEIWFEFELKGGRQRTYIFAPVRTRYSCFGNRSYQNRSTLHSGAGDQNQVFMIKVLLFDGQSRALQGLSTDVLHSWWKTPAPPQNTSAGEGNLK